MANSLRTFRHEFWRLIYGSRGVGLLLTFIVGVMGYAFSEKLALEVAIFLLGLTLAGLFMKAHQRLRKLEALSHIDMRLRNPDPHAEDRTAKANLNVLVVGKIIEVLPHPSLDTSAPLSELGWDPKQVDIIDKEITMEASTLLARTGGYREFTPPNGLKFALSDYSFVTLDADHLSLDVLRTNFFTIQSVKTEIERDPNLRLQYGDPLPNKNRVPSSLGLQYLVRFRDGTILSVLRDRRAAWVGGLWSFSGEEQLTDTDFYVPVRTIETLFKRAFCEEVVALRDKEIKTLEERWAVVSGIVESMRLWAIFFEEYVCNHQLLGIYQLNVQPREFVDLHKDLVSRGLGGRDDEGPMYLATMEAVEELIFSGKSKVSELFGNHEQLVTEENLHPASRYRLLRLLRATQHGKRLDEYFHRKFGSTDVLGVS